MNINPAEIEKMSSEEVDEIVQGYFTKEQWRILPDDEKLRNRLMFVNYVSHPETAHLAPKPPFLQNSNGELFPSEFANFGGIKKKRKGRKRNSHNKENAEVKRPKKTSVNVSEKVRRNPERNTKTKMLNYEEEEIPEDDRYIFCDKCQKEVLDYCDTCGMLVVVKDVDVPVGVSDRAYKTLPSIFEIHESTLHGLGVFVKRKIPQGIQVGPYEGRVSRIANTNGYSWKLKNGKLVDAADETVSNWMRYVNCAPHISTQNLMAFQYKGELFYRTVRPIQQGEELLVYYGNSFARELGIEPKNYFDPQIEINLKPYFTCKYCQVGLSLQKFRDVHEKKCRLRRNMFHTGETFACLYCNVLYSSKVFRDKHQKRCWKKRNMENGGDDGFKSKVITTDDKESTKEHSYNSLKTIDGNSLKNSVKKHNNLRFICHCCKKKFRQKQQLDGHYVSKHPDQFDTWKEFITCKIKKCPKCPFKTVLTRDFTRHLRLHYDQLPFVCIECNKRFNQKFELDGHYVSKHPDQSDKWITCKINKCPNCSYRTVKTSNFKSHLRTHQSNTDHGKYHCGVCGYKTGEKSNFTRHLRLHINQLPLVCIECNKRFNEKLQLDSHYVSQHPDQSDKWMESITCKINKCPNCSYNTVRTSAFKSHLRTHQSNTDHKKYHCGVCGYKTGEKSYFTTHLRLHVDQLPFVCIECNKRFNEKRQLDRHYVSKHPDQSDKWMKSITNKINKCPNCSYRTVQTGHFKSHLRTHQSNTDHIKYHCCVCGYKTGEIGNFTTHLRLHVDQLPFVCIECNKRFNEKRQLDGHYVSKHPDQSDKWMKSITCKINKCPKCSYKTVQTGDFKRHLRTHQSNTDHIKYQ